jgi:hypothetical protein
MKKILITGMSAPQTSSNGNQRALSFAGVLSKVLTEAGHSVTIEPPNMRWSQEYVDSFDSVLVGISPITSLSANNAYGALHAINMLWGSDALTLYIDAPRPVQIATSLRSIQSNPKSLIKSFYSFRRGYKDAAVKLHSLLNAVDLLAASKWPTTLYPALPWTSLDKLAAQMPEGARHSLEGVNLDSHLLAQNPPKDVDRVSRWAIDNPKSAWVAKKAKTLVYPVIPMKSTRFLSDDDIETTLSHSIGALIAPDREGLWWSYRYMQSMNSGTPIATEWRESGVLGEPWSVLGSAIEAMSQKERTSLSWEQTSTYMQAIPDKQEATKIIEELLALRELTKEKK